MEQVGDGLDPEGNGPASEVPEFNWFLLGISDHDLPGGTWSCQLVKCSMEVIRDHPVVEKAETKNLKTVPCRANSSWQHGREPQKQTLTRQGLFINAGHLFTTSMARQETHH